jgi:hypothetical protein
MPTIGDLPYSVAYDVRAKLGYQFRAVLQTGVAGIRLRGGPVVNKFAWYLGLE